ncbi:hypothetical protein DdX_04947 [Ditylenchus destructor]|uniref:Transmembrane protein n=1 Tax=Ditylenchus destructor TaxID=166010 RepID=A0AAD4N8S6_9BILA|nr:hypothetical protein DdX_04947 [Ditylenchus destructor]
MDSAKGYRSFCVHVKCLIGFICAVEMIAIVVSVLTKMEHPLMVCRTVNISSIGDNVPLGQPSFPLSTMAGRGGPSGRLTVHEERICSTYSILMCFALFHAVCDLITLISLVVEKDRLVLPLLLVLGINIVISCLFVASALLTYLFSSTSQFDGYFFMFVALQACFRFYEFVCAKRLYWYYQFCADQRSMPQSSLLRDEEDSLYTFQF